MNQTNLNDFSVHNVFIIFFQLISINRHRSYIAMFNEFLRRFSVFSIIKGTICINTIFSIFKNRMSQNITGFIMEMLPTYRNGFSITIGKRILSNGSSIRTLQIIFCGIATKIIVHIKSLLFIYY